MALADSLRLHMGGNVLAAVFAASFCASSFSISSRFVRGVVISNFSRSLKISMPC